MGRNQGRAKVGNDSFGGVEKLDECIAQGVFFFSLTNIFQTLEKLWSFCL